MPPTFGARFWTPRATTSDTPSKTRVSEAHKFKIQARSLAPSLWPRPKPAERAIPAPAPAKPPLMSRSPRRSVAAAQSPSSLVEPGADAREKPHY